MKKKSICLFIVIGLILTVRPAFAIQFGFNNITANNPTDATTGEAQLSVDVNPIGSNIAEFIFSNTGLLASSITDVYFDDDGLFSTFAGFLDTVGVVDFGVGADPPNLPGGNTISFSANWSFDSKAPAQPNGVNPGESLSLGMFLDPMVAFSDVLAALESDDFRIGIHVQGFEGGGSESFVTGSPPTNPVPEPATMLLFGAGLIGLAGFGRKKILKRK